MIGIISYLPRDEKLRQVRYKTVSTTLEFLHGVFPNEKVNVVDQGWTEEEREKFDFVRFYKKKCGIGLPKARNLMLKEFYESSDTWMILSDDDVALYDYYGAPEFLNRLYYGNIEVEADLIVPLSPQLSPFKQKLLDADVVNYYIFTPSRLTDIPNFLVLRNMKSNIFYNEELDTRIRSDNMLPEDAEFIMNQMLDKKRCVVADFCIKKNLAYTDSTLFPEEKNNDFTFHRKLNENLKKYIYKRFKISSSDFGKAYNRAKPFRIRRDVPYELPKNLATVTSRGKKEKDATARLF